MDIELLDHELQPDEIAWAGAVYSDFATTRSTWPDADPRELLRGVLARPEHALPGPIDLSGNGVWRGGRNAHGRGVAAVFLKQAELHRHLYSRTDQFAMYTVGEAEAFSVEDGRPVLTPVTGGQHFHNPPAAPHAFLPKTGQPVNPDWEIAFIAITPRNLREDTHEVSQDELALYRSVVGLDKE